MISAEDMRNLSNLDVAYTTKKQIFELHQINSLLHIKGVNMEPYLNYTIYKGKLSSNEFISLLKKIKQKLQAKGFVIERINTADKDSYIFRISWEDEGVDVSNLEGIV